MVGSGISEKLIADPGVIKWIPDPDPQHCIKEDLLKKSSVPDPDPDPPDPKLFCLKDPDSSLFHTKLRNMFEKCTKKLKKSS